MRDIFLSPGVQVRLWQRLGNVPRQASDPVADKIDALWQKRCKCDEAEVAAIDAEMEALVIAGLTAV